MFMDGIIRTGVSFFCHDGAGKYVISKRSQNARDERGTWENGGGGLKFGEKVEDALRREIKEEYCAVPLAVEFIGYRDILREQGGVQTHWVMFDFKVQVDPAQVKIGEPHKCDGVQWVTLQELEDFTEPLHKYFELSFDKYRTIL